MATGLRDSKDERWRWGLLLLVIALSGLYLANMDGWLMDDDEGAAFYEAWRLEEGERPGVDFLAEQQPLFLLAGSGAISLFGRDPGFLRALSAVQVLAGALLLSVVVFRLFGDRTAALSLGLILTSSMVFEQAHLFRPDGMMLGWEMAGLAFILIAVNGKRRRWWAVAGSCYAVAVLWKLFGVFPLVGLAIYFLDRLRREPENRIATLKDSVAFGVPFLLLGIGVSVVLYGILGFYYPEALAYHAAMERDIAIWLRTGRNLIVFLLFFWVGIVFLFFWPLWFVNRRSAWQQREEIRLLLWQLPSLLLFSIVPRPIHVRYFLYLIPVFSLLLASQVELTLTEISKQFTAVARYKLLLVLMVVVLAALTARPDLVTLVTRHESDTVALANYVAQETQTDDVVLSDYATINFLANRPSIYEVPAIAGGQIESGAVTAAGLVDRIEESGVEMVLVHVAKGNPTPHQLVNLDDYEGFRHYLDQWFSLVTVFDRNGQLIEVYKRRDQAND